MKKFLILAFSLFVITACNNNQEKSAEGENAAETIGGDKDEHGCLTGAGETWSQLQENCIQVFNVAKRLNPIDTKDGEAVISAFALLNDNHSKVELFIADGSVILERGEDGKFKNETYLYDIENGSLSINGTEAYKAE